MQEEAANELHRIQRHFFHLIAVLRIAPAETDPASLEADQAPIGDGDAMGVAGQVAKHLVGPAEGRLGIDHPVQLLQPPYRFLEPDRVSEFTKLTIKLKSTCRKCLFQIEQELTAE